MPKLDEMKDLGPISMYLGVQINTLFDSYFLYQVNYTEQLLCEVGMAKCRSSTISLPEGILLLTDMSLASIDATYYNHIVGKLIYLMNTKLDISYFV